MTDRHDASTQTRRRVLKAVAGGSTAGLALSLGADLSQASTTTSVTASPIATGFTSPVAVADPPTEEQRLLVADQPGLIHRVDNGSIADEPFLDISDQVVDIIGQYSEMGLLGIALHPDYPETRRVYVRYSAPRRPGTPTTYSHTFVLSEFTTDGSGERVDPSTERTLLEIPQPQPNHNAGDIAFGPDGYLYVGVGDGGGANDVGAGHASDWYGTNAGGNGQDLTTNLLGSILRIDVDQRGPDRAYGIPSDNPLIDTTGLPEQYAWGFRNPWRLSFDGETLYAADVGQNRREEVNRVRRGGNYGWNVREGSTCFSAEQPNTITESCPDQGPGRPAEPEPLLDPIIEYTHGSDSRPSGVSIIGGHLYRGDALSQLSGRYLFTDYAANGRLFIAEPSANTPWPISIGQMNAPNGSLGSNVLAFGRDQDGELLVLSTDRSVVAGETGAIHRLTDVSVTESPSTTTTTTGDAGPGFGLLAALSGGVGITAWALTRQDHTN